MISHILANNQEFVIIAPSECPDYLKQPISDIESYLQKSIPDVKVSVEKVTSVASHPSSHIIVPVINNDKDILQFCKQYGIKKNVKEWNAFRITSVSRKDSDGAIVYFLDGADKWGEQYAYYELAELLLGVRFLKPELDHIIEQLNFEAIHINTGIQKPDYYWRGLYPWHYNYNGRGRHSFCDINAHFEKKDWAWFCQLADWMIKNKQNAVLWFDDVFAHENISGQFPDWVADYYAKRGIKQILGMGWASNEDLTTGEDWKRQICLNDEGKSIETESWRRAICPESEAYFKLAEINFNNMKLNHPENYLGALIGYGENTWAAHEDGVKCTKHDRRPSSDMMLRDLEWMKKRFDKFGIKHLPMGFVTSTHSIHPGNPFETYNLIDNLPKDAIFTMHTYQQSGWRQFERLYDKIDQRNKKERTNIKVYHIAEVAFICNADIPLLKPSILRRRSEHYLTLPKDNTIGHLATLNTTQYLYWYNTYQLMRWQWQRGEGRWDEENLSTLTGVFGSEKAGMINDVFNRLLCLEYVKDYDLLDSLKQAVPSLLPPPEWGRYNQKTHPGRFGFLLWAGVTDLEQLLNAERSIETILAQNETLAKMSDPLYHEEFYKTVQLTTHYYNIRVQAGLFKLTQNQERIEKAKHSLREYNRLMAELHQIDGSSTINLLSEFQRDHALNPTEEMIDALAEESIKDSNMVINIDNGVLRRQISLLNNHINSVSLKLSGTDSEYIRDDGKEFSFIANGQCFSGNDKWKDFQVNTNTEDQTTITFLDDKETMEVSLYYQVFPELPVVRKSLSVKNLTREPMKLESVDIENLNTTLDPIESWVMHHYGRQKHIGPYIGDWNDPLVVVHDTDKSKGFAIGNETIGVLKRTSAFVDGKSLSVGTTHADQVYPFRRWIEPGKRWTSPCVFTVLYDQCNDPQHVVNTVVSDFVRKHIGVRIEQLSNKPSFVYNTWNPFMRDIDEKTIKELAKAASECGIEEFVIDDGWQLNIDSPDEHPEFMGDWEIDKHKFPNGLKPVFDYIKSLGMRPGLWISLATADTSSQPYKDHPEWFVKDSNGELTDLHNDDNRSRTACFGTDWYYCIKEKIIDLYKTYGLSYVKLDLAVLASAYVYSDQRAGCYATDHPGHRDREESFVVIYDRCMQLFDELHFEAPDLFIDCTFETAGKFHLMDYGFAQHAEGNWLSNVTQLSPVGTLRIRNLAWERCPALPATSLVIGNLRMEDPNYQLALKSLAGTLPIMLGDPRQLSPSQRKIYRQWANWLKSMESRHKYTSYRQDLPGFGEPQEGCWDGFLRINTDTRSGGLVGVFRQGSNESTRVVTIPYLDATAQYEVKKGYQQTPIVKTTGKVLSESGFTVHLSELYDGELYEVTRIEK